MYEFLFLLCDDAKCLLIPQFQFVLDQTKFKMDFLGGPSRSNVFGPPISYILLEIRMMKSHVFKSERGRTAIGEGGVNKERIMVGNRSWQTN